MIVVIMTLTTITMVMGAAEIMNDAIEEIRVWMERNFVKVNSKKTEYMLISSPHNEKHNRID